MPGEPRNPFEFGRILGADEIVDREDEIAAVCRTVANRGKLFLIGPRRFGKSSVLKAAAELEERVGAVVLRLDAEKYETLDALARALLLSATSRLEGTWEKASTAIGRFFSALRPELTMDPATGEMSVRLGVVRSGADDLPALTTVLDGIEAMTRDSDRTVAIFLDEFQQIARDRAAERQLRSTVQEHSALAYVFAGSQTSLLREMTGGSDRPFYRLGERLFLGIIPRPAFREFLRSAFERTGFESSESAIELILDHAADVPFNVQQLAHYAWEEVRSEHGMLDNDRVEAALVKLVRNEDPFYTHLWTELTENQRKGLKAIAETGGRELYGRAVTDAYGLSASAMQAGIRDLIRRGLVREVHEAAAEGVRLVDPFFARWLKIVQRPPLPFVDVSARFGWMDAGGVFQSGSAPPPAEPIIRIMITNRSFSSDVRNVRCFLGISDPGGRVELSEPGEGYPTMGSIEAASPERVEWRISTLGPGKTAVLQFQVEGLTGVGAYYRVEVGSDDMEYPVVLQQIARA